MPKEIQHNISSQIPFPIAWANQKSLPF